MNRIEVAVPDGARGAWRVESFEVTEEEAALHDARALFRGCGFASIAPGKYKRLMRGNTVVMSNTPMEIRTHRHFIHRASGHVLINGLGLGMVVSALVAKPDVASITVVERERDVIDLTAPHIDDPRVSVHHADAFEFTPEPARIYDAVWHDIWDCICADNLPEMHRLHRRYARRSKWQGSWGRGECERLRDEWKRSPYNQRNWGSSLAQLFRTSAKENARIRVP